MTNLLPLAHAGHWYHAIFYLAPVLLVVVALWFTGRRDSGSDAADGDADDTRRM